MIPKLIDSVCNLAINDDEIIVITMISLEQDWWKICWKLLLQPDLLRLFSMKLFTFLYSIFVIHICYLLFVLDFFYIISKKCLYCPQKGFVICDANGINFTKEVLLLTHNQTCTKILLLIVCFSINVTVCI